MTKQVPGMMLIILWVIYYTIAITLYLYIYFRVVKSFQSIEKMVTYICDEDYSYPAKLKGTESVNAIYKKLKIVRERILRLIQEKSSYESETRDLISNISHDLKTPLMMRLANLEIMPRLYHNVVNAVAVIKLAACSNIESKTTRRCSHLKLDRLRFILARNVL